MTVNFHVATDPSDRLTIDDVHYTVAFWRGSDVGLRRVRDGLVQKFHSETLRSIWDRSDFRHDRLFYSQDAIGSRGIVPAPTVSTLNDRDRGLVLYRKEYVHGFLRLLALPGRQYKRTYESASAAAVELQPMVDALGHFKLDDDHRLGVVKEERKGRVGKPMIVDGVPQHDQINPPCGETLMRWLWAFQRAGGDPMSLKPNYGECGNFGSHLAPEVEATIVRLLHSYYLTKTRPTLTMYHDKVVREVRDLNKQRKLSGEPQLLLPSIGACQHAISGLGEHYVDTHRYGKDYADVAHPWNGDGLDVRVPGQRVEIDAYQTDLIVLMVWSGFWEGLTRNQRRAIKKKRMWLTVAIDRATRCVVGMRLSMTPDVPNAVRTLEMIESDKTVYSCGAATTTPWHHRCGVMTIVADGGYVSHLLRAAVADARGTIEYPQAGDPKMRAIVERLFRTVAAQLMSRLHGKTFSDIFERADYDSDGNAGWTMDELAWLMVTWVVDIYHNTPHQGLGGKTPNQAWDEAVEKYGVVPWRDTHGRRSAFGTRLKRKLGPNGFEVLGNRYQDDDPNGLRHLYLSAANDEDREFEVLFDQSNMGAITVVVDEVGIRVPNRDPTMEGVRATDMIETAQQLRAENVARVIIPLEIAHDALRRIEERNEQAGYRSSIAQRILAAEEIDAVEKQYFDDLRFAFEPEEQQSEILGTVIGPFEGDIFLIEDETSPTDETPVSRLAEDGASGAVNQQAEEWRMDD